MRSSSNLINAVLVLTLLLVTIVLGCNEEQDSPDGDEEPNATTDGDSQQDGDQTVIDGDGTDGDTDADAEVAQAAFPACDTDATQQTVTFVHINDLHSTYQPCPNYDSESPAAALRGYYLSVKEENPYTLFTDGGDDHEKGSVAEALSAGYSTVEVVHAMKFDVRVIGNHDFAWGPEELLAFSKDPNAIVLASNTEYAGANSEDWGAVDWAEVQVGCVRIGFMGMVSKPWNERNQQYDGDFFVGGDFHSRYDYEERASELLAQHGEDVDLVVMVSHLGQGGDEALAAAVPGIDIILGGHSHTIMGDPSIIEDTIIVQSGSNAQFVTRLDVKVDLSNKEVIEHEHCLNMTFPGTMPVDAQLQSDIEAIMKRYAPTYLDAAGYLKASHSNYDVAQITSKAAQYALQTDAAAVYLDTIWASWGSGEFNQQNMLDTYKIERQPSGSPGFNSYYTTSLNGTDLQRMIDEASDEWVFSAPETIDPATTYSLALQKIAVFNPDEYLPTGLSLGAIEFGMESFEVLNHYATHRTEQCLYVDTDDALPNCSVK